MRNYQKTLICIIIFTILTFFVGSSLAEEPLFKITDNNDNIIFAVYSNGIKVYSADGDSLMSVLSDNIEFYLNQSSGRVASRSFSIGKSAATGRTPPDNYFSVSADTTITEVINSKPRMLWYPIKEAFRVGRVLITSADSVGTNSVATGYHSKAIGDYSQAFGYEAHAGQTNADSFATAIGYKANASGKASFAFGQGAQAITGNAVAIGNKATASGANTFAFGDSCTASGLNAIAFGSALRNFTYFDNMNEGNITLNGSGPIASGDGAFAVGFNSVAGGDVSIAIGAIDSANGDRSVAIGYDNTASGYGSVVSGGWDNRASGMFSTVGGGDRNVASNYETTVGGGGFNEATGQSATIAGGEGNTATNDNATVGGGNGNEASGISSTISGGEYNIASGEDATVIGGWGNEAIGNRSVVGGYSNVANSYCETVLGHYSVPVAGSPTSWVSTERLFVIGNGSNWNAKSNGLIFYKNANLEIGGDFSPMTTNAQDIGKSTTRWDTVFCVTLDQSSDRRLKENISQLEYGLDRVLQLKPVSYTWKDHPEKGEQIGLVAQDVQKIIPEVVSDGEMMGIQYTGLIPVLIEAIKEQQRIMEGRDSEIDQLKADIQEIKMLLQNIQSSE